MLAFEFQATLLGVAAILSAVGGVVSIVWSIKKDRKAEREDCYQKLTVAREEAEKLAEELHKVKMRSFDED